PWAPMHIEENVPHSSSSFPVFLRDKKVGSNDIYWGLVTVLVDFDALMHQAILGQSEDEVVEVALRGRDASGNSEAAFFGPDTLFDQDPAVLDMIVPGGSWHLAAAPRAGWVDEPPHAFLFRLGGALLVFFAAAAAGLLVHSRRLLEVELTQRHGVEKKLLQKALELERTLTEVKTLEGLLPICSHCKNVRDDDGLWDRLERYIEKHSDAMVSHGICPTCLEV